MLARLDSAALVAPVAAYSVHPVDSFASIATVDCAECGHGWVDEGDADGDVGEIGQKSLRAQKGKKSRRALARARGATDAALPVGPYVPQFLHTIWYRQGNKRRQDISARTALQDFFEGAEKIYTQAWPSQKEIPQYSRLNCRDLEAFLLFVYFHLKNTKCDEKDLRNVFEQAHLQRYDGVLTSKGDGNQKLVRIESKLSVADNKVQNKAWQGEGLLGKLGVFCRLKHRLSTRTNVAPKIDDSEEELKGYCETVAHDAGDMITERMSRGLSYKNDIHGYYLKDYLNKTLNAMSGSVRDWNGGKEKAGINWNLLFDPQILEINSGEADQEVQEVKSVFKEGDEIQRETVKWSEVIKTGVIRETLLGLDAEYCNNGAELTKKGSHMWTTSTEFAKTPLSRKDLLNGEEVWHCGPWLYCIIEQEVHKTVQKRRGYKGIRMPQYLSGKQLDLLHFKDFAIMEEQLKQVKNANKDISQQLQSKDLIIKALKAEIDSLKKTGKAAAPAAAQAAPEQGVQEGAKQLKKGNKMIDPTAWNLKFDEELAKFHKTLVTYIHTGLQPDWNLLFDLPIGQYSEFNFPFVPDKPTLLKIEGYIPEGLLRLTHQNGQYSDYYPSALQIKVNDDTFQSLGLRFMQPEQRKTVKQQYSSIDTARGQKSASVPPARNPVRQSNDRTFYSVPTSRPSGSLTASQETTSSASPEGSNGISEREQGDDASTNDSFLFSVDDDDFRRMLKEEDSDLNDIMRKAGVELDSEDEGVNL